MASRIAGTTASEGLIDGDKDLDWTGGEHCTGDQDHLVGHWFAHLQCDDQRQDGFLHFDYLQPSDDHRWIDCSVGGITRARACRANRGAADRI